MFAARITLPHFSVSSAMNFSNSAGVFDARIEAPMREARSSPPAHRGGRVIGADPLHISALLPVSRDGQERKQGSEDNPNVNAHQSKSCRRIAHE
jgi:hypothetical protein